MTAVRSIPVRRSGVLRVAHMLEKIRIGLIAWNPADTQIEEAAKLGLADDIQAAILVLLDAAEPAAITRSGDDSAAEMRS